MQPGGEREADGCSNQRGEGYFAEYTAVHEHRLVGDGDLGLGRLVAHAGELRDDRRQVLVKLTGQGEDFLNSLAVHHLEELQSAGPKFVKILQTLTQNDQLALIENRLQTNPRSARQKPGKEKKHG